MTSSRVVYIALTSMIIALVAGILTLSGRLIYEKQQQKNIFRGVAVEYVDFINFKSKDAGRLAKELGAQALLLWDFSLENNSRQLKSKYVVGNTQDSEFEGEWAPIENGSADRALPILKSMTGEVECGVVEPLTPATKSFFEKGLKFTCRKIIVKDKTVFGQLTVYFKEAPADIEDMQKRVDAAALSLLIPLK